MSAWIRSIVTYCAWWYFLNIRHITTEQISAAFIEEGWTKNYYRTRTGGYGEIYRKNGKSVKVEVS